MPRKTAKQMRLFAMRAERKRKRRDRRRAGDIPKQQAKPDVSGEPEPQPVQLDLIAYFEELDSLS